MKQPRDPYMGIDLRCEATGKTVVVAVAFAVVGLNDEKALAWPATVAPVKLRNDIAHARHHLVTSSPVVVDVFVGAVVVVVGPF